jgi:hypothetical protein
VGPRPGLNPRTLGPMASTQTITPPKQQRATFAATFIDGVFELTLVVTGVTNECFMARKLDVDDGTQPRRGHQ